MTDRTISLEAERGVLGSILIDLSDVNIDKSTKLSTDMFFDGKHQKIFECLESMHQSAKPIDPLTVANELQERGDFEYIGGYDCLSGIQDAVQIHAHFDHYADILIKKWQLREGLKLLDKARLELNAADDPSEVMRSLSVASDGLQMSKTRTTKEYAAEAKSISAKISSGKPMGLPLPWAQYQDITHGIPFGFPSPVAGRDGKTKSSFMAACLAKYWVYELKIPILYIPIEDQGFRFMNKMAASIGAYDSFRLKNGSSDFLRNHHRCIDKIVDECPLYIHDQPCTPSEIDSLVSEHKRKFGIKGVIIDGFKDIILDKGENQTAKEGNSWASLIRTTKKYNVAMPIIMHLSDVEDGVWLTKRKIRGNKQISQSGRFVIMYQDSGFPTELASRYGLVEGDDVLIDVQKCSYGSECVIPLKKRFDKGGFDLIKEGISNSNNGFDDSIDF